MGNQSTGFMESYTRKSLECIKEINAGDFEYVLRIELSSFKEPVPSVVVVSCA